VSKPLVSILVICFNQEGFIREALLSALEQGYENLEVIVADDASSDSTCSIINDLKRQYPNRLMPILGDVNLGITGNSNRGLLACRGKYIAMMGGDDIMLPRKIEKQVAWLEKDNVRALCGHDVEWIDSQGESLAIKSSDMIPMSSGLGVGGIIRYGPPFAATSVMFRSDRLPEYGFHPNLPVISDWKMWIDIVSKDGKYGYIEGVYAQYRRHAGNVTSQYNYKLFRDQLMTCLLSLKHFRGRYMGEWFHYFMYGVLRKVCSGDGV